MSYRDMEKKRARCRAYYAENRERIQASNRAYRDSHPEETKARRLAYNATHREANAATVRRSELRRKFGITPEDYDAMLARQGNRCMICGQPPKTRRLAVDHCHKTGRVRSLLCHRCNKILLGALEHHRHLVERGLLYLDGLLTEPPDEPMTASSLRPPSS